MRLRTPCEDGGFSVRGEAREEYDTEAAGAGISGGGGDEATGMSSQAAARSTRIVLGGQEGEAVGGFGLQTMEESSREKLSCVARNHMSLKSLCQARSYFT